MRKADAVVIGFGKGGKTLATTLAGEGKRVVMVEKSDRMYGGTCINAACIPTKSLIHSAQLSAQRQGSFQEKAERYAEAIEKKEKLTEMLRNKNFHMLADNPNITVLTGTASFQDSHHVLVETEAGVEALEAEHIFINTGARPFVPPIPGIKESKYVYLSEDMMVLKKLPEKLVIIGGGYIGMEFASMYCNFGSSVTVIQDGAVFLPREDAEVAQAVMDSLSQRQIQVHLSSRILSVEDNSNGTEVIIEKDGNRQSIPADAVLVATGRRPNVEGLNPEAAGVELTERGAVKTDEHLHTTADNIWAMGDVAGGLQFTYISLDDYRIVESQILGDQSRTTLNRGEVPYSVFIEPPLSRIGMTEKEAREKGYDVKVGKLMVSAIPKAQVLQNPVGILKAVVDTKTNQILGAHLFCEESHEMINTVKTVMDANIPYTYLRDSIFTHPTMSESFNDLFRSI